MGIIFMFIRMKLLQISSRVGWKQQRFYIFLGMATNCIFTVWVPFATADAGKGLSHARQTLFGGSRTGGFCGQKGTQNVGFSMSKIRMFGCSWHRKSCSEAERISVPTRAQEVNKNPPQRSVPVSYFLLLQLKGNRQFLRKLAHGEFQNLTD